MKHSKIYALLLSVIMLLSFAACNSNDTGTTTTKKATTTTTAASSVTLTKITETFPAFSVKVGDKILTNTDCASLQAYSANSSSVNQYGTETNCVYKGYKITDILKLAGIASYENGIYVEATDGYALSYDSTYMKDTTLLAITKDDSANKGPFLAPCASSSSSDFCKMVATISVTSDTDTTAKAG